MIGFVIGVSKALVGNRVTFNSEQGLFLDIVGRSVLEIAQPLAYIVLNSSQSGEYELSPTCYSQDGIFNLTSMDLFPALPL